MSKEKQNSDDNGEKKPDNLSDFDDFDDIDPMNAYFKQRFSKSSRSSIFKGIESDNDSSLGVLDVDNVSVLDEMDNGAMGQDNLNGISLSCNPEEFNLGGETTDINNPYVSKTETTKSELNLIKQRELAKKTLMQLNDKLELINKNLNSLEIDKVKPTYSKPDTGKKNFISEIFLKGSKNWLDQNLSPQTPKFFKDELNSMSESSQTPVLWTRDCKAESDIKQQSFNSNTNNKLTDTTCNDAGIVRTSSLVFESKNPADVLHQLEEDEKKFIKEQAGLSNNSKISQFSGIAGEDLIDLPRIESSDHERISIGKYFELRSHSINSLIGEKGSEVSTRESNILNVEKTTSPTLVSPHDVPAEPDEMNTARINEKPYVEKNLSKNLNPNEFKRLSEASIKRHSNESSESTSTLLIQNLLCGMDSGLSGTQINDRLLECVGKMKNEKKEKTGNNNAAENMETPKSSKTSGKFGDLRGSCKGQSAWNGPALDACSKYAKSSLEKKRSISKSCSEMPSAEFKENINKISQIHCVPNKNILSLRNKHVGKDKLKGFESSTPKLENIRSNTEKFRSACSKLLITDKDWELPRISSVRTLVNLGDRSISECDKTMVVNCSITSSGMDKKNTSTNKDSFTIEDTIAEGDLTIVSERISEMQQESVCVLGPSSPEGKDILAVVQELANYPKGSIDCSALNPILRDQYPELLSIFSFNTDKTRIVSSSQELKLKMNEPAITSPGSWVNFYSKCGYGDNIFIAVEVKKIIFNPVRNLTKDWLIVSLESVSIQYQAEKYLKGAKMNDEFHVGEFLSVSMKDTLVPPEEISSLKVYLTPKVPVALNVRLSLNIKKITSMENREEDLLIRVVCVIPHDNITITPRDEIDFGVIPEECCEKKTIQICFDGLCDLPFKIFIDKSQNFVLSQDVVVDDEIIKDGVWKDDEFYYTFKQGSKRIMKLEVLFRPHLALNSTKNAQVNLKGLLSVVMDIPIEDCILWQIPLSGSVAFAKFLCNPSYSPFIFRTTEIGKPVKRSFPLKNVGAIGIEFSLSVVNENSQEEQNDDLFIVPKTFYLPKDEEQAFDIVFNGKTKENYVRRHILFQMKPNGQIFYDVELIGVVMPVPGGKSTSVSSSRSGPTQSVYNAGDINFKLKSTTQSISWAAVPLDMELKQTFHIMNTSSFNAVARFAFRKERSAFRFVNENGELLEKLRKVLKPNCSNIMTVVFRPDTLGPHKNSIIIETNRLSGKKMISVNGYGGSPKIFIRNLKSDLNGSKIIRLVNSEMENQIFSATIEFINKGNVSGFVSIKTIVKVLSLSSGLEVEPSNFVLFPNSIVQVEISQKLKNDDIKRLLSGRDIGKLATVTVTTGDEPSRFRLRKLINEQGIKTSESISFLMSEFDGENDQDVDKFDDDKNFESVFRKKLETIEIAAIIERLTDVCESTIMEDFEDTVKEFVTILPATDSSVSSLRDFEKSNPSSSKKFNFEKSNLSASSSESSNSQDKKIKRWLATLEKP